MANGINKIILIGNLGADPESRQTTSGTSMANMNLAVSSRKKDADGNWGDHTTWFNIVCWGSTADSCVKFLSKGRQVYIEGRMQCRKWEADDGSARKSWEVVADDVRFLGSDRENKPAQEKKIDWQRPPEQESKQDTPDDGYNQSYSGRNLYDEGVDGGR